MKSLKGLVIATIIFLIFIGMVSAIPNTITLPEISRLDRIINAANFGSNLVNTGYNITASYFFGDGSQLTGISAGDIDNASIIRDYNTSWITDNQDLNTSQDMFNAADNGSFQYNITAQACGGTDKVSAYGNGTFVCTADIDTDSANCSTNTCDTAVFNASIDARDNDTQYTGSNNITTVNNQISINDTSWIDVAFIKLLGFNLTAELKEIFYNRTYLDTLETSIRNSITTNKTEINTNIENNYTALSQDIIDANDSMELYVDTAIGNNYTALSQDIIDANTSMKDYGDSTFITQANEGNLNVNHSVYSDNATFWSGVSSFVNTWFYKISEVLYFNDTLLNETIDDKIDIVNESLLSEISNANASAVEHSDTEDGLIRTSIINNRTATDIDITNNYTQSVTDNENMNDSMRDYSNDQDSALNTSLQGEISDANTSMKEYSDTQDSALNVSLQTEISEANTSSTEYSDAQDILLNDSVKEQIIVANDSMEKYVSLTYINKSEEGNLNVNSSDYWDNLNTVVDLNDTHFHDCENLTGGQSDLCFVNDTIDDRLVTTFFNATSVFAVRGTEVGTLSDIQTYDGVSYNVTEVSGADGLDFRVNFTSITEFNQLVFRYKSVAGESHTVLAQIYENETSQWENYGTIGEQVDFGMFTFAVFDTDDHIDSNGVVQVRFYSSDNGNTNHVHYFDWVTISKGVATPSGTETDPFSVHRTGDTPLTGNWNQGAFNLTNSDSWFLGFISSTKIIGKIFNTSQEIWNVIDNSTFAKILDLSSLMDNDTIIRDYNTTWIADNQNYNTSQNIWDVVDNGTYQDNITKQTCSGTDKFSSFEDETFTCTTDLDTNETDRVDLIIDTYIPDNYSSSITYTDNANTSMELYVDEAIGNNYSALIIEIGNANTSSTAYADSQDSLLNISLQGEITDANASSNLYTTSIGYFSDLINFTGTLTTDKWCKYDGADLVCNVEPVVAFVYSTFFDQDLNTTDDVEFKNIDSTGLQMNGTSLFGYFYELTDKIDNATYADDTSKLAGQVSSYYLDDTNETPRVDLIENTWIPDNYSSSISYTNTAMANNYSALIVEIGNANESAISYITGIGYFSDLDNFTGTLTSGKWCSYDGADINCAVEPVVNTDTIGILNNTDAQLNNLNVTGSLNMTAGKKIYFNATSYMYNNGSGIVIKA